jgi:hypothetical protein
LCDHVAWRQPSHGRARQKAEPCDGITTWLWSTPVIKHSRALAGKFPKALEKALPEQGFEVH